VNWLTADVNPERQTTRSSSAAERGIDLAYQVNIGPPQSHTMRGFTSGIPSRGSPLLVSQMQVLSQGRMRSSDLMV
jgi:hypothetical protein